MSNCYYPIFKFRPKKDTLPIVRKMLFNIRHNYLVHKRLFPWLRKSRQEVRDSCFLIMSHLIHWVDLRSAHKLKFKALEVFKKFTIKTLAETLNLSWSVVQRALVILQEANYIFSHTKSVGRGKTVTCFLINMEFFPHIGLKHSIIFKSIDYALTSIKFKAKNILSPEVFALCQSTARPTFCSVVNQILR